MLFKLSVTGIKGRLRDYVVLFFGLVMSSAIFYMFESIATNKDFLASVSVISMTMIMLVFRLGSILLALITLVYILYANSFLMAMRQKDYGMFMMLGAKSGKIAQMIFIETFAVGILATITGSVLGIGLTAVVNTLLTQQLNVTASSFSPFSVNGLVVTLIFYTILFFLTALLNAGSTVKKPILKLLRASATPNRLQKNKLRLFIEAVIGVIFLAVGYVALAQVATLQLFGLELALVTIILGTYLLFRSVVVAIITLLKKSDKLAFKGLNNFTLSQLSFRIRDYTQMLSMVSILFALALGASTVGLGFHNQIEKITNNLTSYDLVLNNAQKINQEEVAALKPTLNAIYTQKSDDTTIYYSQAEFDETPLYYQQYVAGGVATYKTVKLDGKTLASDSNAQSELRQLQISEEGKKELKVLPATEFANLDLPVTQLQVIQVPHFTDEIDEISQLVKENETNNPSIVPMENFTQKYYAYSVSNSMYSSLEFMGFFLGIAFLTMLASCLMFKILSGANSDVLRYSMLDKIGTRHNLLKASIRKEIGVLFALPGLLGVVHVLFGLQMFKAMLSDPYEGIWLPFTIFFVLYLGYYLVTTWIYTGIVLKKEQ